MHDDLDSDQEVLFSANLKTYKNHGWPRRRDLVITKDFIYIYEQAP